MSAHSDIEGKNILDPRLLCEENILVMSHTPINSWWGILQQKVTRGGSMKSALLGMVALGLLLNTSVTANGQLWLTETVDTGSFASPSIAVDSLTRAHISYGDTDNLDLRYATNLSGTWVTTTVDSVGDVGRQSSIAVDSSDKVHIVYRDITTTDLKYTSNASGHWVTTTVDSTGLGPKDIYGSEEGAFNSIAVDSAGKVHISYRDLATSDLKYATNASGPWMTTTLDFDLGWFFEDGSLFASITGCTSIAVDNSDKVHIGCIGEEGLWYATNVSGSWVTQTVDSGGEFDVSIAVDSLDNVHIIYRRAEPYGYAYATNATGSWVMTNEDSVGWGELAIDSLDHVHTSYFHPILALPPTTWAPYGLAIGFLQHATNASDSWGTTTVTLVGGSVFYWDAPSIAVDSLDNVHIIYRLPDRQLSRWSDLKYATNKGCFIATAVLGSELQHRINILRSFRDLYLVNNSTGKAFIKAYNKYSPPLGDYIADRGWMRILVRTMLLPIIGFLSLFV
jgi:hypothetical protein